MRRLSFFARCRRIFEGAAFAAAILLPGLLPAPALAIDEAEAKGPPYHIEIFVGSRNDVCYDPGDVAAIKRLTLNEAARINRHRGILGRPIELDFLDNERDTDKSVAVMRKALDEPDALAMIGLSNSTRSKAVFDALGPQIGKSGIPFISDISVNSIFQPYANVFTTRASQDDDSVPVIAQFLKLSGFSKVAFVGLKDAVYTAALGDGLKKVLGESVLISDLRLNGKDNKLDASELPAMITEITAKQPDLLYLSLGGDNATLAVKQIMAEGLHPALFLGGRIESLPPEITSKYPAPIYRLAWDQPPEVYNDRLRKLVTPDNTASWIFEGQKIAAAPGWAKGECKPRNEDEAPDPFSEANLRAISTGSQYADMVGLVAAAARSAGSNADFAKLRATILKQLSTGYAAGRGAFKGTFDNWSFVPASRTAARDPFIVMLPPGLGRTQLAPYQFVRTKSGSLRPMQTLYADVDMIKAHRIDENDKSFFAEFYLSMRDVKGLSADQIEFANAYLDPSSTGGRQITIDTIHGGGPSDAYPDTMKIYKVAGRFLFEPRLKNYPFDTQRFSIELQPKSGDVPFIVQPPPADLRDGNVATDGWNPRAKYVGYEKDFVPVINANTLNPSVVPFYKSDFVWQMQRETTDYILRVAVPLGFIMIVAYLSIFIPRSNFEAIVTIQVTALLSAVALYLSLPKLDSDVATLSDRMFVFAYLIVSVMIFISILRVNPRVNMSKLTIKLLKFLHIAAIPAFVALATYYVYALSIAGA